MKGILCYISSSGHTALASQYLSKKIENIDMQLLNIAKDSVPDIAQFDLVGFATYTDYMGAPVGIKRFIDRLPQQNNKPAFIFSTYAFSVGWTLKFLSDCARNKGFCILAASKLPMPECYAVLRNMGFLKDNNPNPNKQARFDKFIRQIDQIAELLANNETLKGRRVWPSFTDAFMPSLPRSTAKFVMGPKFVDPQLCTQCGICADNCPYNAISINTEPHFDEEKCNGCYSCYSKCPTHAIFTKKMRDKAFYNGPSEQLKAKFNYGDETL